LKKSMLSIKSRHAVLQPLLIFLLLAVHCSSTNRFSQQLPSWVLDIPNEKGKLYAVGTCGRTYIQKNAWERAADAARSEMAKNVQAHVQNAFLVVQRTEGNPWADEAFVVEATSSATDAVMGESQVVALWYDELGVVPGSKPGTTYVLAVMNLSNAIEKIKTKIEHNVSEEEYEKIISVLEKK